MSHHLRFRQIHLDFHTSPHISGIGKKFNKKQWQEALKMGHVDSITCFSKCHHGWSYHPSEVGKIHPALNFNLLRMQMDASKEMDVNVPVYLSAGVDNVAGSEHPEWREIGINGCLQGWAGPINQAGFFKMCFNTPYLDYLCEQIREAVRMFPEADGIFLDIISQGQCCCKWCLEFMREHGLDANKAEDRQACAQMVIQKYYIETTAACRADNPKMPVFHNSGHVAKGNRQILGYFSHLELESLPTGGWGYDHFPLSARYVQKLGLDYMGMTGKFHTTWGEFGGYKHPNALRYECALSMANGAKCSVGDQLHPNGWMDETTYRIIGEAYKEVEAKEQWCDKVTAVADIAVLSSESETGNRAPDNGAGRVLLEGHFLFDLIDRKMDFSPYKLLILPDEIAVDEKLKTQIDKYIKNGGKLLLTGRSGLRPDGMGFTLDIGAEHFGESPFQPDYLDSDSELIPALINSPLVMYARSQQVKPTSGKVIGSIRNPYFNRTWEHFCSHQHAPASEVSAYAAGIRQNGTLYLAHPIFTIYFGQGAVAYKDYATNAIKSLLRDAGTLVTNLPSTARVTLMDQPGEKRYVLHLLYANTVARGAGVQFSPEGFVRNSGPVEVIEDLLPLRNTEVELQLPREAKKVTFEPQGAEVPFEVVNGRVKLKVDEFTCHQMVVLHY